MRKRPSQIQLEWYWSIYYFSQQSLHFLFGCFSGIRTWIVSNSVKIIASYDWRNVTYLPREWLWQEPASNEMRRQEIVLSTWLWLKHLEKLYWGPLLFTFNVTRLLWWFRNEAGNLSFNFSHSLCRLLLWRDKLIRIWNVSLDWELAGIGDDNRFENRSLIHSRDLSCYTLCLFLDVVSEGEGRSHLRFK